MKNKFMLSGVLFVVLLLILISPSIAAVDFPAEISAVTDTELAAVEGMGFNLYTIGDNNNIGDNNSIGFEYTSSSYMSGNAFKNAKGVINVSSVSGNGNVVNNIINMKICIMSIHGDIDIDFDEIGRFFQDEIAAN